DDLVRAEGFEQFLQLRYPTAKRFSLEGSDALVPLLDTLIEDAGTLGVEEVVFGMPHRGRLDVLANILREPYELIRAEFAGSRPAARCTSSSTTRSASRRRRRPTASRPTRATSRRSSMRPSSM